MNMKEQCMVVDKKKTLNILKSHLLLRIHHNIRNFQEDTQENEEENPSP